MAKSQQLEVYAAPVLDGPLIGHAHGLHILRQAVRHQGVLRTDGDVVKQILLHEVPVALGMVGGKALVLIQIHRPHAGKVQKARLLPRRQLAVQGNRGGAGGQAQHAGGLGGQDLLKLIRRQTAHLRGGLRLQYLQVQHDLPPFAGKFCLRRIFIVEQFDAAHRLTFFLPSYTKPEENATSVLPCLSPVSPLRHRMA